VVCPKRNRYFKINSSVRVYKGNVQDQTFQQFAVSLLMPDGRSFLKIVAGHQ